MSERTDDEILKLTSRVTEALQEPTKQLDDALEKIATIHMENLGPGGNRSGAMLGTVAGYLCARFGYIETRALFNELARNEQFWRIQAERLHGRPPGRPRL